MSSNDRLLESLSALVDGECDELETARVLKQLRNQTALRQRWQRLHLGRALLHGEVPAMLPAHFAERVAQILEGETLVSAPVADSKSVNESRNWSKPLLGFASVAGVVAAVVLGLQALESPEIGPQLVQQEVPEIAPFGEQAPVIFYTAGTRWNLERVEIEQRLNAYLLNHMEYAPLGEVQGILPYSRLASYDASR